jgi:hypothetical protein
VVRIFIGFDSVLLSAKPPTQLKESVLPRQRNVCAWCVPDASDDNYSKVFVINAHRLTGVRYKIALKKSLPLASVDEAKIVTIEQTQSQSTATSIAQVQRTRSTNFSDPSVC